VKKPAVVKVAAHTRKPPTPPAKPVKALVAIAAPAVPPIDQIRPPAMPTPALAGIIRGGAAAMRGNPPMPKAVVAAEKPTAPKRRKG